MLRHRRVLQAPGLVSCDRLLQEQPSKQAREHPHGQKEAGPARDPSRSVERDTAARHDHVYVRMVGHCRTPAVQDRGDADSGSETVRIGGDGEGRFGRGPEQNVVDHRLVVIGDVGDRRRQRVDNMKVRHREQLRLALGKPFLRRRTLALWAMSVAAGVVGNVRVRALLASRNMTPERRRAAALDRAHHLHLAEADVTGIGLTPCGAEVAEDVGDLQNLARHAANVMPAAGLWAALSWRSWASFQVPIAGRADSRWPRSCRWQHGYSAPSCRACRGRAVPE